KRLEPYEGKLSRTFLRGGSGGNATSLPDNSKKLRTYLKQKNIQHLVGIDRHVDGDEIPETMKRYRTRGTPEMAIIDKEGRIRFQRFGSFDPASGVQLINQLLAEDRG
ncbi:MAG: hypothetical protein M3H12_17970, partial [Chromatiales bacterium]